MNKEELKQLIKEEILKEFSFYKLEDKGKYKDYQDLFLDVIDDLTRRKITKSEAIYRVKQLIKKFATFVAGWSEDEAYDDIAFMNDLAKQGEEAKKSQ